MRAAFTSGGTWLGISAAGVPRRGLNGKMCIFEKPISRTTRQVAAKSSSVSPGKPTITSVVKRRAVERFLHQPAAIDDALRAPAAAHAAQNAVGAALQRDVQVRANFFGKRGHHGDQFARDFGGFDAGEAHAEIAGQFGDLLNEIRQPHPLVLWAGRDSIPRRSGPGGCR